MTRLLILGGTGDAANLATEATKLSDLEIIYSLAGRTRQPKVPGCTIRIGGFGGTAGLISYLKEAKIDFVVDATHPFADVMATHAAKACRKVGIPRIKFCRMAWSPDAITWKSVQTYEEAAQQLCSLGKRVFLSIGTKKLISFARLADKWFLIRAIEDPALPVPLVNYDVLLQRGPFDLAHERTLLVSYQIDVLVSKNSGGTQAAKLQAAHDLNIPILIIEQPTPPTGELVYSTAEAADRLKLYMQSKLNIPTT